MRELIRHFGKYSIVRADYVAITGDACAAQILASLEFWTMCKLVEIEEVERRNIEAAKSGVQLFPVPDVWLYEKIQDFIDALCGTFKRNKVIEALKLLKDKGFIESKPSSIPRDQTLLYKLNVEEVQEALDEAQGFKAKRKTRSQSLNSNDESLDSNLTQSLDINCKSLDSNSVQGLDSNSDPLYNSRSFIQDKNSTPLTPQGEPEEGGGEDESLNLRAGSPDPEVTASLSPQPTPQTETPYQPKNPIPEIKHPPAIENDSRFLPSDPTAENMEAWKAIAATGAMKGASHPDPNFLEFYRVILSKCTHYKGRDCNANHAKAALRKLWQQDPLRILAEAENWQQTKAATTVPGTRDIRNMTAEEKMAILQRVQDRKKQQTQGV